MYVCKYIYSFIYTFVLLCVYFQTFKFVPLFKYIYIYNLLCIYISTYLYIDFYLKTHKPITQIIYTCVLASTDRS